MRLLSPATLAVILSAAAAPAADKPQEAPVVPPLKGQSETIQLFNGKNLDGWEGYSDYWSVQDGVIVGKNSTPVSASTYLLTKRKFRDFHLVISGKLVQS